MTQHNELNHTPYGNHKANQTSQPFFLPDLPYGNKSLEPHMSAETFDFHHAKHHNTYVQNLNKLLESNESLNGLSLEKIILNTSNDPSNIAVFNNAAQIWNHSFFWHSMSPEGGNIPTKMLADKINEAFGNYDSFVEKFKTAGATQFGSGWVWLVYNHSTKMLEIIKTSNADTTITQYKTAIITCDVWEHAYYIDYRNKRPDYINIFLTHLVNWEFAQQNLENALKLSE